ncbi:hypothetical protein M408DRAFT_329655 [Serendipita vermifera MAFF 305830]|uniref:Uncharacterized protein n=1 Tax=Serendipita vermifera MAFF 305830 TaxID=933852 RepID=A0A0C3B6K5_SERVB|nr:hypothetical protein M408DRAFT_329920 [Serendipita vermifera MAFF 305830]KIM27983.1 hypothetical protein M408DRAFT_329655 [Serendipita vermifera MAFF 305830]
MSGPYFGHVMMACLVSQLVLDTNQKSKLRNRVSDIPPIQIPRTFFGLERGVCRSRRMVNERSRNAGEKASWERFVRTLRQRIALGPEPI